MQRVVFFFIVSEQFVLGMHHLQFAAVRIEFDLSVQRRPGAGFQPVRQVGAVKPLGQNSRPRGIGERGFKQSQIAPFETADFRGLHFGDYGCQFSRRKLGNRLQIAAILIAKREVVEQVLHSFQAARGQHFRACRANAFNISQSSVERESQIRVYGAGVDCRAALLWRAHFSCRCAARVAAALPVLPPRRRHRAHAFGNLL